MHNKRILRRSPLAAGLALAFSLAGCSDSSPVVTPLVSTPQVLTGNFVGLSPEGLTYSTATQQGTTGPSGSFQYESGETVTFALGGTPLGSTVAAPEVNVFDLVGLPDIPTGEAAINRASVTADNTGGFNAAARIVQVLLSFDADADSNNGVQILAQTATRLDPIDFRVLGVNAEYLFEDLKRTVRISVGAGEFAARVIPTQAEAIQVAYDTLGVSTGVQLPARVLYDENADGVADDIDLARFDSLGVNIEFSSDSDADGMPEFVETRQYFSPARASSFQRDANNDGVIDRSTLYTYDEFGELTREESDFDGRPGVDEIVTIQYNANGVLIRRERQSIATGTSLIQQFNTDSAGNRTEYLIDNEGDGLFERRDTFVYNEFRDWVRREIDDNNDGIVDLVLERSFNSLGIQTLATTDSDADGVVDRRTEFVIGSDNRLARAIYDTDDDPEIEFTVEFRYNSDGFEIQRVTDRTGQNRSIITTNTTYDNNGNRVRVETDSTGDGQVNSVTMFGYDANGFLAEESRDNEGDGVVDFRVAYTVNAAGVLTEERRDVGADGTLEAVNQFLELTDVHATEWY
ncbi:MAG: hypothetical protein AAF578_04940 [Pseudomonadota bacterium]